MKHYSFNAKRIRISIKFNRGHKSSLCVFFSILSPQDFSPCEEIEGTKGRSRGFLSREIGRAHV